MNPLPSKRRSELRAEAHKLSPVVLIGDKGLTESVVRETDRALSAHELIKVRASTNDREARSAWMAELCEKLSAHAVQEIGKVLVLYRQNPEKALPKPAKTPAARPARKPPREPRKEPVATKKKMGKRTSLWTKKPRDPNAPPKGILRPRSRAASPRPASGPLRRRPRTSR